jgi:hypothetical protein
VNPPGLKAHIDRVWDAGLKAPLFYPERLLPLRHVIRSERSESKSLP